MFHFFANRAAKANKANIPNIPNPLMPTTQSSINGKTSPKHATKENMQISKTATKKTTTNIPPRLANAFHFRK